MTVFSFEGCGSMIRVLVCLGYEAHFRCLWLLLLLLMWISSMIECNTRDVLKKSVLLEEGKKRGGGEGDRALGMRLITA